MHGRRVCPSKLKIKVKSYRKKNGSLVKKYARKVPLLSSFIRSPPQVSFKDLTSTSACKDSVDLAHSLYVDELCALIRSVGRSSNSNSK